MYLSRAGGSGEAYSLAILSEDTPMLATIQTPTHPKPTSLDPPPVITAKTIRFRIKMLCDRPSTKPTPRYFLFHAMNDARSQDCALCFVLENRAARCRRGWHREQDAGNSFRRASSGCQCNDKELSHILDDHCCIQERSALYMSHSNVFQLQLNISRFRQ